MEPAIGNNLSEEFDDKLTMTTSEEEGITEDEGESSTESDLGSNLGSAKQCNDEGSSGSKGNTRKQPISTDFLDDMNEAYECEFVVMKCENDEEVSVPVSLALQSVVIKKYVGCWFR
jgi:hypothetical protein